MDVSLLSPDVISQSLVFGPDLLHLIEIELQNRRMTYRQIAVRIHAATGTVGSWFSRGAIPADKVFSVIAAIGSAKLWQQALSRIPGNAFVSPYLDATDHHPLSALDEAVEIAESFLRCAKEAKPIIRHRKAGYQFQPEEMRLLIQVEDSIADLVNTGQMFLIRIEDNFGRPVRDTMIRHSQRQKERGLYTAPDKRKSRPYRAAN